MSRLVTLSAHTCTWMLFMYPGLCGNGSTVTMTAGSSKPGYREVGSSTIVQLVTEADCQSSFHCEFMSTNGLLIATFGVIWCDLAQNQVCSKGLATGDGD